MDRGLLTLITALRYESIGSRHLKYTKEQVVSLALREAGFIMGAVDKIETHRDFKVGIPRIKGRKV